MSPAADHQTVTITFFVQFWLREVLWSFSGIQPLRRTSPVAVEDPLLITRHNPLEKWVVFVAQKERRRHLKTTIFILLSFNSCGTHSSNFFDFPICFKWQTTVEWSTSISTATSRVVLRESAWIEAFKCSLSTAVGRPRPSSSSRLSSPLRNFLNHRCTTRSLVVPGPNASLISRAVSAAFRPSLNWNKKIARIWILSMLSKSLPKMNEEIENGNE